MSNVIHKLIQPSPKEGHLREQVLCWRTFRLRPAEKIANVRVSTDINQVDCHECWKAWNGGVYS